MNYSVVVALDIEGMVGWMIFRGSLKGKDFFIFLMELIKENDSTKWKNKNPVFFMDNASIHRTKNFIKNRFSQYYTIIYNVPYSSQLNPIEYRQENHIL